MKECVSCSRKFPDHMVFCPFDGDMLDGEVEDPLIGRVIDGKYRLEEKLGEGGMGTVYRAKHVLIQNDLAVKILHSSLVADRHAVARFQREATAAARIKHPNAVGVTDFGRTEDEIVYIVMELFVGKSLRDVIEEEGPLPLERSITIVRQVCLALDAAHRSGVVHRDIKPDNIVLEKNTGQGELVKVLDFGIAKLKDGPSNESGGRLTRQGVIIGSPHYLSPEQCQNAELDARSDIYSLGIVLYEMLTADVPFKAPTPIAVAMMHTTDQPPHVKEKRMDLPDPIADIVMSTLEKDPPNRPQSAIELAQILERSSLESGIPVPPLPGSGTAYTLPTNSSTNLPVVPSELALPNSTNEAVLSAKNNLSSNKFATTGSLAPEKSTTETKSTTEKALTGRLVPPITSNTTRPKDTPSFIASTPIPMPMPTSPTAASLGNTSMVNLLSNNDIKEVKSSNSSGIYVIGGVVVLALVGTLSYFAFFNNSNPISTATPTLTTSTPTSTPTKASIDLETMLLVKGGKFKMGFNTAKEQTDYKYVSPEHEVTVEDFYIDKFEVTNQQYKKFIDATDHPAPKHWLNRKFSPGQDLYPVIKVSLEDAKTYAEWAGKRLPTEEEWEFAARGNDGRVYPWGQEWQDFAIPKETSPISPSEVGKQPKGASPCGALDMAGNVWEWTDSKFTLYTGSQESFDNDLKERYIVRGGSFGSFKKYLTTFSRNFLKPTDQNEYVGFRCAKSVK